MRIKVVPNDMPNDDGRWVEVNACRADIVAARKSWSAACAALAGYVPRGHHIVAIKIK